MGLLHNNYKLFHRFHHSYCKQLKLLSCVITFYIFSSIHDHKQPFFQKISNTEANVTVWCWQMLLISLWMYSCHFKSIKQIICFSPNDWCYPEKKWPIWPGYTDQPDLVGFNVGVKSLMPLSLMSIPTIYNVSCKYYRSYLSSSMIIEGFTVLW